jgi:hypothetical protein
MTMHLIRGVCTLNTRKPKFKMTKAKYAELQSDWMQHNRDLKRQGLPKIGFDEYVDNRRGIVHKKPSAQVSNVEIFNTTPYRRDTQHIPSLTTMGSPDSCAKKESIKYTGTLIKGIATMHKSNAVPVINEEQMQDISRMRRG